MEEITLGMYLKRARSVKKESLERLARDSGIPLERLTALEEDTFLEAIPETYVLAYLRKIARCLDIQSDTLKALYEQAKEDFYAIAPVRQLDVLTRKKTIFFSRDASVGFLLACIVCGFLGYQAYNYFRYPFLSISFPSDSYVSTENQIDIKGKTEAGVSVAVNGDPVKKNGEDFIEHYFLTPGVNVLDITAKKRFGKQLHIRRIVMYNPESIVNGTSTPIQ